MDPYRNIFYGAANNDVQIAYDLQLENNTIKALINVLENTDACVKLRGVSGG
jgi:hypothetical protein